MVLSEFKQGSVIHSRGEPMQHLLFITKGGVHAEFGGHLFRLEQGDVIGLSAINAGSYVHTYTAVTDVTVFSYPYRNPDDIRTLLTRGDMDVAANCLVTSMCRQAVDFLQYKSNLKQQAEKAYALVTQTYPQYESMCTRFAFASKKLSGLSDITRPVVPDLIERWMHDYYAEMKGLDSARKKTFFHNAGISLGFVLKAAEDILRISEVCIAYQEYLKKTAKIFLDNSKHDFFALIADLHVNSVGVKGADAAIEALMAPLADFIANSAFIDTESYQERLRQYKENLTENRTSGKTADAPVIFGVKQNLADSLQIILEYSGYPEEICNKFARNVHDYAKLSDKGSPDDDAYSLRRELTEVFYDIYKSVFIKSLNDTALPTIIKMFLNFGYMDANLAGHENADYLYSIADSVKGDPSNGVYTISEWLAAIYNGQKEPSRNDFDEDYTAYIREMRISGKIDAKEEERLLSDAEGKLLFEIEHVFPIVNKITFGRMQTFCPLFSDANVQRKLETSLVRPEMVKQALDEIRSIDFSAYTRETLYSDSDLGVPREFVHVEFLPDFILMPNAGIRGAMWQEIEGRKRATPSRMFLPIFLMNDHKPIIMRLTAEFRWEICKRIQGPRWNDMSDPSLTSEFFDYLQFYRNNRDLSPDAKSNIKAELLRAKNVYKAVFVSNYADWLLHESNGSPRLNKFVRKIMFTYCPFSAPVREKLALSPQYSEVLKLYDMKNQQKVKRIESAIQKVSKLGNEIPRELLEELEYLKK